MALAEEPRDLCRVYHKLLELFWQDEEIPLKLTGKSTTSAIEVGKGQCVYRLLRDLHRHMLHTLAPGVTCSSLNPYNDASDRGKRRECRNWSSRHQGCDIVRGAASNGECNTCESSCTLSARRVRMKEKTFKQRSMFKLAAMQVLILCLQKVGSLQNPQLPIIQHTTATVSTLVPRVKLNTNLHSVQPMVKNVPNVAF
ncbi:hypothetical protein PR048_012625 [Dryococelus australis]|uniref:Uncharacterized protein n=1 Tax=Dryococelus australis TaxID=614101 RepID=A0ABQ9HPX6_9NEOP|nr:hypothetical protein PR048_012625 [Dryococelus australis]